jgi:hypothetical protein
LFSLITKKEKIIDYYFTFSLLYLKSKILIFHAEDNWHVPKAQSDELVNLLKSKRSKNYPLLKYVELKGDLGLGHFIQSHMPVYREIK